MPFPKPKLEETMKKKKKKKKSPVHPSWSASLASPL
jgi:hypothetical protein